MPRLPSPQPLTDYPKPTALSHSTVYQAEVPFKIGNKSADDMLNVTRGAIRVPSPSPSILSTDDSNNIRFSRDPDFLPARDGPQYVSSAPDTFKGRMQLSWIRNKGLFLVLIAQFFGALMNVTTRLLEMEGNDGKGYHPFHVLFARMSITVVCASLYMWYKEIEHFPLGMKQVRPILVARGLFGFFGIFGMYYSLLYLPLADATVITFLAPSLACWACSYFIHEPFTRMEQIAAYVSLFGVVIIARPMSLFAFLSHSDHSTPAESSPNGTTGLEHVTPAQRAAAVGVAMLGVIGSAGAYTTLRWIGKRAHPLISVNYFAVWCTIVSIVMMATLPGVGFLLPRSAKDWCYLIFLGICGFVMQFLLAAGLQYEKSSRATNMVYTQMLFALGFDKLIWGTTPGVLSIIGSSLILGSAIFVAMRKEDTQKTEEPGEGIHGEEEEGLLSPEIETEHGDDPTKTPHSSLRA